MSTSKRSTLISGLLHALAIAAVVLLTARPDILKIPKRIDMTVFMPRPYHVTRMSTGGGGGGQHSPAPPTKGPPPRDTRVMVVPPLVKARLEVPALPVAPSILGPVDTPVVNYQIGIPLGVAGPPSGGPDGGGGIGGPDGTGIGPKSGPNSGDGGPGGNGAPRGKKVTRPELLTKNEPEYTEDARKAKLQGTVELAIVVGADGRVSSVQVVRGLGLGLDEKAVDAVRAWRFRPATSDGKPVATLASVAVTFRLL